MNILSESNLQKLLIDSITPLNLQEEAASNDINLKEAAKIGNELFNKVVGYETAVNRETFLAEEFPDSSVKGLVERQISTSKVDGTIRTIQKNLKGIAEAAERRIYSGLGGFFLKIFHAMGFYNPAEVVHLKELSEKDISLIKTTAEYQ